jgi:site-specific DNA-methyltransferase (adenine-specific)
MELNKIYNENCLLTMERMDDNFIDLTVTSPPYNNFRDYKGYDFDFEKIAGELYRVTKQGGVVVWVVGDQTVEGSETGSSFSQALYFKEIGFSLHDTMIYQKNGGAYPGNVRYNQTFEYMFVLSKGKPKTVNLIRDHRKSPNSFKKGFSSFRQKSGETIRKFIDSRGNDYCVRSNVWKYETGYMKSSKDKISFNHPAIFPEKLANDHILSWSNIGDIVYDCFMGSGTVAKMAKFNDRIYIGSEISSEYCKIAEERLEVCYI